MATLFNFSPCKSCLTSGHLVRWEGVCATTPTWRCLLAVSRGVWSESSTYPPLLCWLNIGRKGEEGGVQLNIDSSMGDDGGGDGKGGRRGGGKWELEVLDA